jgi:hypothetical protein
MSAPLLVLAGFALVTALLAWSRWLADRRWAAAGNLLLAIAATGLLGSAWPVVRNLGTYQPMHPNQAVAEMFFEQAGARRYRATLTRLPSGRMQVFELEGDEWRLDARGLDWTPRAAALGLRPIYQLELLEARTSATAGASVGPSSRFTLHEAQGMDLWSRLRAGSRWSVAAGALTLPGTWQPMAHRQRFHVWLDGADALAVVAGQAAVVERTSPAL